MTKCRDHRSTLLAEPLDMLRPPSVVDPRAIRDALDVSHEPMGRLLDVSGRTVEHGSV